MPYAEIPEKRREYQITIVRIDDFPKPSTNSEVITRIAGTKQILSCTNARADELRAHIGKTFSREEFAGRLGWRLKMPLNDALELLDDLCGPN